MRPVLAPAGTVVLIVVVVLPVTVAAMPLNVTTLLAGVASKFVPVMVTGVPLTPAAGANEVMVGGPGGAIKLCKTDSLLFVMTSSGFPSLSRSPALMLY